MLIAALIGVTVGGRSRATSAAGSTTSSCASSTRFFAIPLLFVILVAARFFGDGDRRRRSSLIFGLLAWPLIARLVRASFLSLREADFVEAARAVGVKDLRITFRHILPNALGPVIVAMTLLMASNIVLEAFVSFLNFGIKCQRRSSWGNALANAQ